MRKNLYKNLLASAMIILIMVPAFALALPVQAQDDSDTLLWGGTQGDVENTIGLGAKDPREIAASIINIALGFLGIVAVIIILLGGFKWMTAGGNEDKVEEAKKLIFAGIIGLIIIMAAWGIAKFVVNALYEKTGATG
ncbi:MAG: pilin [Patescibacteria group bacterium]|nr:pilin [Patescibacteria group bacterium]MDD5295211.1 pilin [Patescibacteria group bacterium]MDD5554018.1 pilin [Patescibacteria group bacterium]